MSNHKLYTNITEKYAKENHTLTLHDIKICMNLIWNKHMECFCPFEGYCSSEFVDGMVFCIVHSLGKRIIGIVILVLVFFSIPEFSM